MIQRVADWETDLKGYQMMESYAGRRDCRRTSCDLVNVLKRKVWKRCCLPNLPFTCDTLGQLQGATFDSSFDLPADNFVDPNIIKSFRRNLQPISNLS